MLAERSRIRRGFGEGIGVAAGMPPLPPDSSRTGEPLSSSVLSPGGGGGGPLPEPLPRLNLLPRQRRFPGRGHHHVNRSRSRVGWSRGYWSPNKEPGTMWLLALAQNRALAIADVGPMPQGTTAEAARQFTASHGTVGRGETVEAAPSQVRLDRSSGAVHAPVIPTGMAAPHRDPFISTRATNHRDPACIRPEHNADRRQSTPLRGTG